MSERLFKEHIRKVTRPIVKNSYTELEQLKTTHPVRVRSYNWCFSIPPRCSNYRTEIKEVTKFQVSKFLVVIRAPETQ